MKKYLSFLVLIALLGIAAWFYKAYKTVPELPAYDHDLVSEQGTAVKLSDFKGKYILISYFQTWCGSCIRELPSIDALQTQLGTDKLEVLLVSDEPIEKILRFKEKYCNTLEYYTTRPFPDLGIRVFPTTYLINPDGKVILSKLEGFDWSSPEVLESIK
ncbi:MAG TPA: TlpA disulfide reductase family protein [Bacteroidia bacterium]|jgi:thiol-disulfide isomerase/thioredoxin